MKNYYEILEVSENASPEIIEKSYKILAKKYHPDTQSPSRMAWAEDRFKEISEAYQVLSDRNLRKEYDLKLGINTNKYQDLYYEQEKLKEEINNLKENNKKTNRLQTDKTVKTIPSYFKNYIGSFKDLIYNETQKSPEERSKDFKALLLTIIIVSIIVFIFWKVPFLNNLIFP